MSKRMFQVLLAAGGGIPCIIVDGAGSPDVDGKYTERGISVAGLPYYNLVGSPDNVLIDCLVPKNDHGSPVGWNIYNSAGVIDYDSADVVLTPDLVTTWRRSAGIDPVPTVTPGFV